MRLHLSMKFELYQHQKEAVKKLSSGSLLYGKVGSGKTLTALTFYKKQYSDKSLIVITTAKKRDSNDWLAEADMLDMHHLVVDSWNNIKRYSDIKNSFFIFDEQRVIGNGTWTKSFLKIAKHNKWILLSGTPGDTWMDYMPLFIANGFYRNKTDFIEQHVEYERYTKFPKVKAIHNSKKLSDNLDRVMVQMKFRRKVIRRKHYIDTNYPIDVVKNVKDTRFNPYTNKPIRTPSEYTQVMRRLVAESDDRKEKTKELILALDKVILFYNYNYERDILLDMLNSVDINYGEYSGHKHDPLPKGKQWVYLVQYTAGAEGWNCTETDRMIFYSPNYSYRIVEQCEGRIDRLNSLYSELHYYYCRSDSSIDKAVFRALATKRRFNEKNWGKEEGVSDTRE